MQKLASCKKKNNSPAGTVFRQHIDLVLKINLDIDIQSLNVKPILVFRHEQIVQMYLYKTFL